MEKSMSAIQVMSANRIVMSENTKQWVKAALIALVIAGLYFMLVTHAHAAGDDEFKAASDKFETWIKGNLGKLAAFVALAVGSVVAAVKKDWSWFFGAVVLSIGVGILAGIINASFTATI
jgi:conjugal transfer pilus assembly protein TraA